MHQRWLAEVEDALEGGFKSKSQKKESATRLSRIWERIVDKIRSSINEVVWADAEARGLNPTMDEFGNLPPEYVEWERSFVMPLRDKADFPASLTHVRERHLDKIQEHFPEYYDDVFYIKTLLDEVKAAEVSPLPPKKDPTEAQVERKVKSIFDEMAKRQKQFTDAVEMGRLFGGLRVTAYPHWGRSKYGRDFIRVFYYLNGRVTPLSVIVAAAQELERQGKDVPVLEND